MRCLNMKIGDVLFFIVNFIAIYSMKSSQDKTPQTTTLVNEEVLYNNFDKYCPHLSKIVREHNLTDYTINCKPLNARNIVINEENVLGYACLIVKNILNFMCVRKLNMTSDFLIPKNVSSICPFNFSHLEKLGFTFNNNSLINELKSPDHCSKICSDLYTNKTQCVVLTIFNNYLKNFNKPSVRENSTVLGVSEPSVKSEHPEEIKQNTENGVVSTLQDKLQQSQKNSIKEDTIQEKIETKIEATDSKPSSIKNNANEPIIEEKKNEKPVSSTPSKDYEAEKKAEVPETEKKILEYDNNDLKQKNEDLNEDDDLINEDDASSIGEQIPKTDFSQETKLSKVESPEIGIDSPLKGKEIYSGEGFFQAEDSHFFFYFITVSSIIVVGYLAFHNKNKILAYALEGTNSRRNRRRPNPARYRKLETNLEEVISSNTTNAASSSVVY